MSYNEDTLTQQTMADYLSEQLGWDSVYAYNQETFGHEGTLGRKSDRDVLLTRYIGEALHRYNPGLPDEAYTHALRQITDTLGFQSIVATNCEKYELIRDGVTASFHEGGEIKKKRLRLFDFDNPENNHFLCVREMWVRGVAHRRRPDIIGFVNGFPLLFVECKRPDKSLRRAYEDNIADYKDTIPHMFHFNGLLMLANGIEAKIGSITARYEHFSDWKRLAEGEKGVVAMETLLKGVCTKANFLDIFENFILFDESAGGLAKIVARNHQYLGVNRAMQSVVERKERDGKLGVFWHTQGSGKSYSMALFAQKVRRKLGGDFTFLILTDRTDLDNQIYKTFSGVGLANNDKEKCRADSGGELKQLLGEHKAFVFSLIQKFNNEVKEGEGYSQRENIIVMTDEAHRTQYGTLALNMRNALPNASFIGFTGTPLFTSDEITQRVFGGYISTYDFQRAIEDKATLPLYYDARGDKLGLTSEGLNEKLAKAIEEAEIEDADVAAKLENELKREYHVVTAEKRLRHIAEDFASHYSTNWETGKAMFVAIDKITAVRMHDYVREAWNAEIAEHERQLKDAVDEQDLQARKRQIAWMQETAIAVVVSDEQGEVDRFRKWNLDIMPHRKLMKDGFTVTDANGQIKRLDVETAFKKEDHPFRIVIVCAMWLTGFDVPSLSTLYLDKPLQAHTLMQAIARANRVKEGKNNGLIVDYCGILKNLRKALATFAGHTGEGEPGEGGGETDPLHPEEELLDELREAIGIVADQLQANGFELATLHEAVGMAKNAALLNAKEAVNIDDESRKKFEISARAVFRKYKACLTFKGVQDFRHDYEAIGFIYKMLEEDRENADTSAIIQSLNAIVSEAIDVKADPESDEKVFDISKINFELLRKEFEKSPQKKTDVQNLKDVIAQRLRKMLMENPLRTDFQERFDEIVRDYNKEKDKNTIEATFEALMRLTAEMQEEELEYVAEGFDTQEQKTIYDMLRKPELSKGDIRKIKAVSVELLQLIQSRMEQVQDVFAKQSTSDGFRQSIYDFLYDDKTGLPAASYTPDDVEIMADSIYGFVKMQQGQPAYA
ncbi:type I restriction endonuclease subunit R [Parasphingorhabdus halotolerans]|uniref:Type I restriction enzyme endonuclease subunit n=1 Tax=Parasphingorhabdus halotolerans TaxID=2725558 RepID=A0A6H2DNA8_9SPHN|nr:type I restriction endonuclease subunit R [Parasphingorhabdus halotolerans]QJB69870.1 type I restriction endonuclease subunit R [Parasphingorhabdus halotolerans]